jgi:hypothetical protein
MMRKSRMVLAAPGPLLTPPPSSSSPKTPYRSYSGFPIHNMGLCGRPGEDLNA